MPLSDVAALFGVTGALPDDPGPRSDAAPGEMVHAVAVIEGVRQLLPMRWGMIPVGRRNARGRPVMDTIVNVRSEGLFAKSAFAGVGRAILPVNGWYEWTGENRRKTRWRIEAPSRPMLAFAAVHDLWAGPGGVSLRQLATVTCAPNADVAPYHHRMPAILDPSRIAGWLEGDGYSGAGSLGPAEAGLLTVASA
jgi:putative SOS response-associated peptidase YedK